MEPVNLLEYEPLARQKLSESAYGFIAGAAEDEVTLRENRAAFQRLRLRPRVLVDVSKIDPSTTVLGQRIAFPVLLAPVAVQRLAHPDGELASARAAAAAGTIMALSTSASCSIEEVARAAEGPRWFQLYFNRDREVTRRLVERAEAHGYSALCLTVDLPWLGRREADIRNRLQFPPDVTMANFAGEGARALLIGRPYIWGLAVDGEEGVKRVLSILRFELELAMALAGCPAVADIGLGLVVRRAAAD